MSASCQLVDSVFEVRPIGARTKFKPVKKPEVEIPSVEHVAELVEGKHSNKYTFYTLRFGCSFAIANTIKPQLL